MARRFPTNPDKGKSMRTERRASKANSGPHDSDRTDTNLAYLPTRADILKFIEENPDRAGKRDIAKAFNLKGNARIHLKDILRDLTDEGELEKRSKKLSRPGTMPSIAVLDITGRDSDGGLMARPAEWPTNGSDDDENKAPLVLIRRSREDKGPTVGIGDRIMAKIFRNSDNSGPRFTARLIKRLERHENSVLGVLRHSEKGGWRIEPVDRKQPEVLIDTDQISEAKAGDLVEVEVTRSKRFGPVRGKVSQVVGALDSEKALSMIAIHAHDIPHVFPESVLEQAEKCKPLELGKREDWRNIPLVTIDPADAKDHDDAVFAERDEDPNNLGGYIVYVAIADVAAYVTSGSAMDKEALHRGNSVYFPDRVVPMLPERISNNLCSLREGEDRPALAVRMIFSAEGRKKSHTFHRVMMRSAAHLAYGQAQAAIDGAPDDVTAPLMEKVLKPLWEAYFVMKRGRDKREPLELDLPEKKILLTSEGKVDKVIIPERLDAHKLIEECMIQANVSAAESLEQKKQPLIFRIHDSPSMAKQEGLREFLRSLNISLARGAELRPSQFNGILYQVKDTDHEELVNQVVLRSQSQAEYSPENIGHFGLNLHKYAHFTSPIRRYADLIVHRALIGSLHLGTGGITPQEEANLAEIAAEISITERRAMLAERETVDRLIAHHLAGQIGDTFQGRISGVTKAGLFVALATYGADGFIPISTLGYEYYLYDEANHSVAGERSGKGYRLGDIVDVKLIEALPVAGALRFEMVSEPRPLPSTTKSYHKSKRASRMSRGKSGPSTAFSGSRKRGR
ncbi:ribonuclease R [Paenochrobactrum pullorum]|uniref:ribonuclease R n=1 Tax=Paenochrobactrum pullorum TaxID=1324351 RepID=UPI0035BC920E